ncbi:hypothetical protein ACVOMT_11520 [Sphingomonas panni]
MTDTAGAPFHRSPAQFFFEIGFQASFAEATVRARNVPPFELTDAIIERAWQLAPEGHPEREEFEWYLEQADGVEEDGPWQGPPAAALERYYLIGTDSYGDGVWSDNPCPTNDGSDFGAVEYVRADLLPAPTENAAEGRFWLIVREPGMVPRQKGPFRSADTAKVLREFIAANPRAFIDHLTIDADGTPWVDHGPEVLQMTDGRSMSVGRKHNERVRAAAEEAQNRPRAAVGDHIVENSDGKFVASFSTRFLADFFVAEGSGCYRHRVAPQIAPANAEGEA